MMQVRFLGCFAIEVDGCQVGARLGMRAQALLARVILQQGTALARVDLATSLWPTSRPGQALTNLRRELHALRHSDGHIDRAVEATSRTIMWPVSAQVSCDVHQLRALIEQIDSQKEGGSLAPAVRTLLALDRGLLLTDLGGDWIASERHSLQTSLAASLRQTVARLYGQGDHGLAATVARRIIQNDRLDETGYELLLWLQVATGQRSDGLNTWHDYCAVLKSDLGLEPSPRMHTLYQRLTSSPRRDSHSD